MDLDNAPPLVSCVMATADRRAFVPRAVGCFLRQDYPCSELIILDDGADPVVDLALADPRVRYIGLPARHTLGAKRNLCAEAARGDLIMHWDDDDWMAPRRISYQVAELLRAGAEICGLRDMLFLEPASGRTWLYRYPAEQRPWLAGNSLLYTRDFWRRAPFPDLRVGADLRFVWGQPLRRAVALPDVTFYVATIHQRNNGPKDPRGPYWELWPGDLRALMGSDLDQYVSGDRTG